jgi:hypothetical protein
MQMATADSFFGYLAMLFQLRRLYFCLINHQKYDVEFYDDWYWYFD